MAVNHEANVYQSIPTNKINRSTTGKNPTIIRQIT